MIATMSSVVATGRKMKGRDGLIVSDPLSECCFLLPDLSDAGLLLLPASVRMAILAPSRSLSAPSTTMRSPGDQPRKDLDTFTVSHAEHDLADRYGTIGIDEIDKGTWNAALNTGRRHHRDVVVRIDQQPDIDELIRVERALVSFGNWARSLIVPVRRIDLTVEGLQHAIGDLVDPAAIVSGGGQRGANLNPL